MGSRRLAQTVLTLRVLPIPPLVGMGSSFSDFPPGFRFLTVLLRRVLARLASRRGRLGLERLLGVGAPRSWVRPGGAALPVRSLGAEAGHL